MILEELVLPLKSSGKINFSNIIHSLIVDYFGFPWIFANP